jgi:hypothetical protein
MSKVVDINPTRRLDKEALDDMKSLMNAFTIDDVDSIIVIAQHRGTTTPTIAGYGTTFATIGIAQTVLTTIAQDMLAGEFLDFEDDTETTH